MDKKKVSEQTSSLIRLNRYIASAGICSRRNADVYIASGNVKVNNKVITEMGYKVSPTDTVSFDDVVVKSEKKEYFLLNKPKGFITTTKDEKNRRTVMNLINGASTSNILPVGRLDRNTTGLLMFTNDGDMTKKLTHPKHAVQKLYHVTLDKNLTASDIGKIKDGIMLNDGKIEVDQIQYIDSAPKREVGIAIHSGRNRIVRRIFEKLGYDVIKLDRVIFGGLTKKGLPRGQWRKLTKEEIIHLKMI